MEEKCEGAPMIGIRLADGSYYPILAESEQRSKQLSLMPANDNQESVRVLFYQADDSTFANPRFFGKITLDDLLSGSREKSEQNISLTVEMPQKNVLMVHVSEGSEGDEQDFLLNIQDTEQDTEAEGVFADSDVQIEDADISAPSDEFIGDKEDMATLYQNSLAEDDAGSDFNTAEDFSHEPLAESNRRPLSAGLITVLSLLATVLIIALSFLIFRLSQGDPVPFMEAVWPLRRAFFLS